MNKNNLPEILLRKGKEESLDRFHPWVFSGAIASLPDDIEEGEVVAVIAYDGRLVGVGHYQIGSIAVRMLDFADTVIDKNFFVARLNDALRMRKALHLDRPDNNAYRLVHGEGDFLPGLIVDIYGTTAVVQAHSPGMHYSREVIALALTEMDGIEIANVYYKSETTLPYKAQLDPRNDYLIGGFDTNVAIENGLQFHIDWLKGQKTGFFVDQRDNRMMLERFCSGRNVLNMFCYTGGFSVYALRGG
ncbi:MAG: class I SAM-dependent methyltransferase, partial [Muribaculaceae bacterium]|nr:class I SAM-dependent methyltransferase [Muribaculaceae bacterium]